MYIILERMIQIARMKFWEVMQDFFKRIPRFITKILLWWTTFYFQLNKLNIDDKYPLLNISNLLDQPDNTLRQLS